MDENTQIIEETNTTIAEPEIKSSRIKERLEMIRHIRTEGYGEQEEKEYLLTQYDWFLQAVQQGEKKIHLLSMMSEPSQFQIDTLPKWDEKSDFAEWINEARRLLVEVVLPDIKLKLKTPYSEFNPSPFQVQMLQLEGDMKFELPDELEKLDKAWHEFEEWKCSHDKETCDKFLNGKINLTEKELIASMTDKEMGKIALQAVDRLGRRKLNMGAEVPHIGDKTDIKDKSMLSKVGADKHYNPTKSGIKIQK